LNWRLLHILGVRERSGELARELVLANYEAKRWCWRGGATLSAATAKRPRGMPATASIVGALARQLADGDKAQVGDNCYRWHLRRSAKITLRSPPDKVEEEKRFEGSRAYSCYAPTPISTRSKPCSPPSSCGQ
jgi:hypothetical protein